MRIAYFTDAYMPQVNGVATSVEVSANALRERGHEVYIVAPKYPGYKDKNYVIRLSSIKIHKKLNLRLAIHLPEKAIFKISKIDFDIIHGHSGGTVTLMGWELARFKRIPFVFTYHTLWNQYTHYFFKGKLIRPKMVEIVSRIFSNQCDTVIAPSTKAKNELLAYRIKKPIVVVPNGLDIDRFAKVKKGFLRKKIGLTHGDKILLSVGRLGKEKSQDFLIQAFKEISDKKPRVKLVIVGSGQEEQNLKQLADRLGLDNNVHFIGAILAKHMPKVYNDADIFLFASLTENHPMVLLEAIASGLPIVAVYDPAIDGMVKHRINGIVTKRSISEYAKQVRILLEDRVYRRKLAKNSKLIAQEYSVGLTAERLERLYEKLIVAGKQKYRFKHQQAI